LIVCGTTIEKNGEHRQQTQPQWACATKETRIHGRLYCRIGYDNQYFFNIFA
jgi:hypothetical protein